MSSRLVIYISTGDDGVRSYVRELGAQFLRAVCEFSFVDEPGPRHAEAAGAMRAKIAACDAVVHLVGNAFGPGPEEADDGGERRSFAQMEYDLAVELAKPLHVGLLEGDLAGQSDESEALRLLQARHRAAITAAPRTVEIIGSRPELRIYLWSLAERLKGTLEPDTNATRAAAYVSPPPAVAGAGGLPESVPQGQPFPAENVVFTVYRPGTIRPGNWEKLLFFAHLDEQPAWMDEDERTPIEEVEAQAAGVLGRRFDRYSRHSGDSRFPVPRDGEITLAPEMAGVEFEPARRSFFWHEGVTVHGETFRLRASSVLEGQVARGRITVFLGALILAEIGLAVRIGGPAAGAGTRKTSAAPFRKIFASYSHRDAEVVETLERHARTLGDEYLRDWMHLRSGEQWDARLLSLVEQADVFQLFWSNHAARSPFVEREWRHALRLGREAFVRPTYWELPMPPPPPDLAGIHFHLLTATAPRLSTPTTLAAAEPVAAAPTRPILPALPTASVPTPAMPSASAGDVPDEQPYATNPVPAPPPWYPHLHGAAPPTKRSPSRLWWLLAFALISVALGGGYWFLRHPR